jgi:hypothetical protein
MSQSKSATSAVVAFNNADVVRESQNYLGRTARLKMDKNQDPLYLPAWAELSVSSAPAGTNKLKVTVQKDGNSIVESYLEKISGGSISNLIPGSLKFIIDAQKDGSSLASLDRTINIHPGKNDVSFDFSSQTVYAEVYRHDYKTGYDWAPLGTKIFRYYAWKRNSNSNAYNLVRHYGDFTSSTKITHPLPGASYSMKDNCLGPDEITAIFGSNIFDIGADEVAVIELVCLYEYNANSHDTIDSIEPKILGLKELYKTWYYEVYNE